MDMLGTLNPTIKEATIIGAGFAGLMAAYRMANAGYELQIYEKGPWVGGLLGTTRYPYGLVERSAHSFRASKSVRDLCRELEVDLVPMMVPRKSFILRNGEFRRMPLNANELVTLAMRALTSGGVGKPETLEDFGRRHMGEAAVDYMLTPLSFGIYGARPSELHLPEAFPRFGLKRGQTLAGRMLKRRAGGHGRSPMMAPKNGIGELVEKLHKYLVELPNVSLHSSTNIDFLTQTPNRILAVPAHVAGQLIEEEDSSTAALLKAVRYVPLITATVFVERESMRRFPGGAGVLVPEKENLPILGVLFNSQSFENRVSDNGIESLTVIMGGTPHQELITHDESVLEALVVENLERIFGLARPPLKIHVTKWPHAIPLYDSHLALTQQRAREGWCALLGNVLLGNYTGQVSMRGMIENSLNMIDEDAEED